MRFIRLKLQFGFMDDFGSFIHFSRSKKVADLLFTTNDYGSTVTLVKIL